MSIFLSNFTLLFTLSSKLHKLLALKSLAALSQTPSPAPPPSHFFFLKSVFASEIILLPTFFKFFLKRYFLDFKLSSKRLEGMKLRAILAIQIWTVLDVPIVSYGFNFHIAFVVVPRSQILLIIEKSRCSWQAEGKLAIHIITSSCVFCCAIFSNIWCHISRQRVRFVHKILSSSQSRHRSGPCLPGLKTFHSALLSTSFLFKANFLSLQKNIWIQYRIAYANIVWTIIAHLQKPSRKLNKCSLWIKKSIKIDRKIRDRKASSDIWSDEFFYFSKRKLKCVFQLNQLYSSIKFDHRSINCRDRFKEISTNAAFSIKYITSRWPIW